ncbi:NlpC/P60 family protein [Microvirga mediterraneensis]|uniref:C40 family peptidase n=1 Tax=Microvirga mediterraneensis TaxID=2754695 RepID=A0A838BRZ8_9HYPH|nr:NlpC/P60 family protein [Microvirga mediterraneensis]MBA1157755.1 C40 family peptidase [Microvirga mediterraneensis]
MDRLAFYESLIGKPYRIGARGEDGFDCYGLAQHVQLTLAGIEMPDVEARPTTTRQQAEVLLDHPERNNWVQIEEPEDLCLVLMGNVAKRDFHLGTYVVPSTVGGVLHITKEAGVVFDDMPALKASGWNYMKFYKRIA